MSSAGIVTPDAVGLDLQLATLGSRGAAYLLDLLVLGAGLVLVLISQSLLGGTGFVPGWFGIALLLLFAFAWQFGYPIAFEVLGRGRTPGKAVMGLRVITVEGAPVGLRHATIRATVGLVELLGTTGAIAVLSSFLSPRSQRLGDMAAGTLVVRERRGAGPPASETFRSPVGLEAYTAHLDVSGLGADDYATIRETLRRVRALPADVAAQLTTDLARRIAGRITPAPPAHASAEAFLTCVVAAVQARRPGPAGSGSAGLGAAGLRPAAPAPAGSAPAGIGPAGVGQAGDRSGSPKLPAPSTASPPDATDRPSGGFAPPA